MGQPPRGLRTCTALAQPRAPVLPSSSPGPWAGGGGGGLGVVWKGPGAGVCTAFGGVRSGCVHCVWGRAERVCALRLGACTARVTWGSGGHPPKRLKPWPSTQAPRHTGPHALHRAWGGSWCGLLPLRCSGGQPCRALPPNGEPAPPAPLLTALAPKASSLGVGPDKQQGPCLCPPWAPALTR